MLVPVILIGLFSLSAGEPKQEILNLESDHVVELDSNLTSWTSPFYIIGKQLLNFKPVSDSTLIIGFELNNKEPKDAFQSFYEKIAFDILLQTKDYVKIRYSANNTFKPILPLNRYRIYNCDYRLARNKDRIDISIITEKEIKLIHSCRILK